MPGLPGYYSVDDGPGGLVTLPVAERYGAQISFDRSQIILETEKGKRWVYPQFKRISMKLTFRVTTAELAAFEALDALANGAENAFYFVHDTDDMAAAFLCRKEKDYAPKELDEPAWVDGVETAVYDYTLEITEEPEAATLI